MMGCILLKGFNMKEIGDCKVMRGEDVARHYCVVSKQDDCGGEEEEVSEGGAQNQMVEAEKGRLLCCVQEEVETSCQ